MRSRGLDLPGDDVIEAHLDFIAGNPVPAMRLLGQSLTQVASGLAGITRISGRNPAERIASASGAAETDSLAQLKQLGELLTAGVLTQAEFEQK